MRLLSQATLLSMLLGLLSFPGWSAVLYSNGPINGTIDAHDINSIPSGGSFETTNSFVISSTSTVTAVSNIGLWAANTPLTVSWVISTAPAGGGTVMGSGSNVSLSTTFLKTTSILTTSGFSSVYVASFSTGSVTLSPGTYYLELFNATVQGNSEFVFWDVNNGPSTGCGGSAVGNPCAGPIGSESFEVDGNVLGSPGQLTCNASANIPIIDRTEGVTELVGDIVISCTGGTPTPAGLPVPQTNIIIDLNTGITSRLLSGIPTTGGVSEAVLSIDEPFPTGSQVPSSAAPSPGAPAAQLGCVADNLTNCATLGTGGGVGPAGPYSGSLGHPNLFQGSWNPNRPNAIIWTGVPIDPPGIGTRVIRITNLRANASVLNCSLGTEIFALISVTGSENLTLTNAQVPVGFIFPGLTSSTSPSGDVSVSEGFASAFKPRDFLQYGGTVTSPIASAVANGLQNVLGFNYNSESGFVTTAPGLLGDGTASGAMGLADTGTQLTFQFSGSNGNFITVPNVIYLYPVALSGSVTTATGASGASGVAVLADAAFAPGTTTQLLVSGGLAAATYEVLLSDPAAVEFAFLPSPGASVTSASFAQSTTYTYRGNPYNTCGGTYCIGGPYDLSIELSTTLTGGALANLPFTDITSSIASFAISDGSGLIINNHDAFAKDFSISTDASGNILTWLIESCGSSCNIQMQTNWHSPSSFVPGADFSETTGSFAGSFGFLSNDPGTWSTSSTASAADPVAQIPRFSGSSSCPALIPATQVSVTASGLAYSRPTQTFNGTVTIKNISSFTINGPIQIGFAGLNLGVYLVNATGVSSFVGPYITAPVSSLAPGQTSTVKVQFKNLSAPPGVTINLTPVVYSGSI